MHKAIYTFLALLIVLGLMPVQAQTGIQQLLWPVGSSLHEEVFLLMHVDNDRRDGVVLDYQCNDQYAYDGHRGTDITAFNFRLMDEGIPVYAAADGVVSFIRYNQFDRNYWPPYVGDPNGVVIRHADGSNTQYWHLRTNSVAVNEGEAVQKGQIIGYIGSSGATPIPHLHFEFWENSGGTVDFRDPFSGGCNNRTSLWEIDIPYPGDTELKIFDMDVFTDTRLAGNESNNYFGETKLKDRPFRPATYGIDESILGVWVQLQANQWERYTIRILKPDGQEFASQDKLVSTKKGVQWHVFSWAFSSQVSIDEIGNWRIEILRDGDMLMGREFMVDEITAYGPRFYPLAGRSIRLRGNEFRDRLMLSGLEGDVTFELVNAPSYVSLKQDEVVIESNASPESRNTTFEVAAVDMEGRADTMYYHLVAPFSTPGPITISTEGPGRSSREFMLQQNYPNPFRHTTSISYELNVPGHIQLEVYNSLGQRIETLVDAYQAQGRYSLGFSGSDLKPGIYFYRLQVGNRVVSKSMVIGQ